MMAEYQLAFPGLEEKLVVLEVQGKAEMAFSIRLS